MKGLVNTKESESTLATCSKCGGKLKMEIELFGQKMTVPVMCKCRQAEYDRRKEEEEKKERQIQLDKLRNYSLMDKKFENCTFENFRIDEYNANLYKIAKNYCKQWPDMKKEGIGLLLWGPPGTGKTYTSFCIANKLMENLTPVIAISSIALISKIYESYRRWGNEGEVEIINSLNNADLLVIDDLGAEAESKMGREKQILYSIIDSRYRNGKPMIVSTNLSLTQLKEKLTYSDGIARTYDRLVEMCTPIKVEGQSRRILAARNKQGEIIKRLLKEE